jgi:hypothetical protein
MIVFFHPVKFGVTFTLGNMMALGRSVAPFLEVICFLVLIEYVFFYFLM